MAVPGTEAATAEVLPVGPRAAREAGLSGASAALSGASASAASARGWTPAMRRTTISAPPETISATVIIKKPGRLWTPYSGRHGCRGQERQMVLLQRHRPFRAGEQCGGPGAREAGFGHGAGQRGLPQPGTAVRERRQLVRAEAGPVRLSHRRGGESLRQMGLYLHDVQYVLLWRRMLRRPRNVLLLSPPKGISCGRGIERVLWYL